LKTPTRIAASCWPSFPGTPKRRTNGDWLAELDQLTLRPHWPPEQRYNFACIYALAGDQIKDRTAELHDRAMQLFGKAVDLGWDDADQLAADKDLESLRQREDSRSCSAESGLSLDEARQELERRLKGRDWCASSDSA